MNTILAALDNSAASRPVLTMACALAPTLGATVQAVHVDDGPGTTARAEAAHLGLPLRVLSGDPLERIRDVASHEDVVAVVVGSRGRLRGRDPAGHVALELADCMTKPVVMVPPDADPPERLRTVLVAMKGASKARGIKRAVKIVLDAGIELVVVHVDEEDTIPAFSDQVQHETEAYAREFLARYYEGATVARFETRVGVPAEEIIDAAHSLKAGLIAVGWPQSPEPGRGAVAREIVDRSPVPVLLLAVA
ncbi:MAG: universal stress protein [Actinomycetota bacterium]|nr:universal stress protein [Actinomycetota bacterium]